jgi:DNA invertase Pin-like site-specific DNA recombinase
MAYALAYIRDFKLGNKIIARDRQIESIKQFAEVNGIEINAWFEDTAECMDVLSRPGIQSMLNYGGAFPMVICERISALAPSLEMLAPFLKELESRGVRVETASPSWDCVSQQYRRRAKSLPARPRIPPPASIGSTGGHRVARPARLYFAHLVHRDFIPMR